MIDVIKKLVEYLRNSWTSDNVLLFVLLIIFIMIILVNLGYIIDSL
jgi:hypothetical protein